MSPGPGWTGMKPLFTQASYVIAYFSRDDLYSKSRDANGVQSAMDLYIWKCSGVLLSLIASFRAFNEEGNEHICRKSIGRTP